MNAPRLDDGETACDESNGGGGDGARRTSTPSEAESSAIVKVAGSGTRASIESMIKSDMVRPGFSTYEVGARTLVQVQKDARLAGDNG